MVARFSFVALACVAVCAAVLSLQLPASATPYCFDYGSTTKITGRIDTPGSARGVCVVGSRMYVADHDRLSLYDIGSPDAPVYVGGVGLPGAVDNLIVVGPFACVTNGTGLTVVQIVPPTAPIVRGSVTTPGTAGRLVVGPGHVYVADGSAGVQVVDVTDPDAPFIAANLSATDATAVAVGGDHAYVADTAIRVFDVSEPSLPVEVGSVALEYPAEDVQVAGPVLYATARHYDLAYGRWEGSVEALDLTDPAAPSPLSFVGTPATDLAVSGDLLLVSALESVRTIDAADPADLDHLSAVTACGGGDIAVGTERAYLASGAVTILAPTATPAVEPETTGSFSEILDVAVVGKELYAAAAGYGSLGALLVYEVTGGAPAPIGSRPLYRDAVRVVADGQWAFVSTWPRGPGAERLYTIDISSPANPTIAAWLDHHDPGPSDIEGGFLYAEESANLRIYEIGAAGDLTPRGATATWDVNAVKTVAGHAFLATTGGLAVYDVSDPDAPALVGTGATTDPARNLVVSEKLAYVVEGANLTIFDVTTPSAPAWISSTATYLDAADQIVLDGGRAYVRRADSGFRVVDVVNPWAPFLIGSGGRAYDAGALAAVGAVLVSVETRVDSYDWPYSTGHSWLRAYPLQCGGTRVVAPVPAGAAAFRLAAPAPNPFRGGTRIAFELPRRQAVELAVFDVTGRRVRVLERGALPPGAHTRVWNGRNEEGRVTSAGVYFVQLRVGGDVVTERAIRLR